MRRIAHIDRILILLILIAFALRLHRIALQSWWWDEGYSTYLARHGILTAIRMTAVDIHPPLYYILLSLWGTFTGYNEFTTRFLSTIFGILTLPLLYRIAREGVGRAVGLLAAGLATLAPAYVYYSQETRMYTLFALEYLFALFLLSRMISARRWSSGTLIAMGITEAAMMYTHYFSVVAIIFLNLAALLLLLRQPIEERRWNFRRWALTQALVILAYAPWLPPAYRQTGQHSDERATFPTLLEFLSLTWHFFNIGIREVLGKTGEPPPRPGFVMASAAYGIAFAGALLSVGLAIWRRQRRIPLRPAIWLAAFALPLLLVFGITRWKPIVHPRYILMLTPALLLTDATLITALWGERRLVSRALALALALAIGATFLQGLWIVYYDPAFFREDVRGVAAYLSAVTTSEDAIVVDSEEYTLQQYYTGPSPIQGIKMRGREAEGLAELQAITDGKQRVFLLHWFRSVTDDKRFIPFLLEAAGRLIDHREFAGYTLWVYELERPVAMPPLQPTQINFGDRLWLSGAFAEGEARAGEGVAVALRWRMPAPIPENLKAAVALLDPGRQRVSGMDWMLMNDLHRYTARWSPGEETTTYFVVPVPLGAPPGPYTLTVTLYREPDLKGLDILDEARNPGGRSLTLGAVKVHPPRTTADPYGTMAGVPHLTHPLSLGDGLQLLGFQLAPSLLAPGEPLRALLLLQADRPGLPDQPLTLEIARGEAILGRQMGDPGYGHYPLSRWIPGLPVLDRRVVWLSSQAAEGPAEVRLRWGKGLGISLGTVEIAGRPRRFDPPLYEIPVGQRFPGLAELVGISLDRTILQPGDTLNVRLIWRALNEDPVERPYVVSVQVLNEEGRLVGQDDRPPAHGVSPTTSWVQGEYIEDPHPVTFREPLVGEGRLIVVLYDPDTMQRVRAADGRDHLELPVRVKGMGR
ncbi:glycosyltransferase family 39 protein [Thermoflexus sp.]|uniref:glycosyltransferase family 39 protein n=1 Tax=Thermoflexus sp. TaxID=1969742 RepID=UPI002ADDBD72|nr:glycosyltransferase family 39 protein [Thermoflexus sp.]